MREIQRQARNRKLMGAAAILGAIAIEALGGSIDGVIRTRMMLCDADDWPQVAKAHGEVFAGIDPAATCVVVKGLLDSDWLVETEVDCVVAGN